MPRKNNGAKWNADELREIQRLVRRYNSKRRRAIKNELIAPYQPEAIRMVNMRSLSRKEARIQINNMKRYLKKGAEQVRTSKGGAVASNYQINTARAEVKRINRARAKEYQRLNPSHYKGNVHIVEEANLSPMHMRWGNANQENWSRFLRSVVKQAAPTYTQERLELYKANYLKAMRNEHLPSWLIQAVANLDARTVVNALYDNPVLEIGYLYSVQDVAKKVEILRSRWSDYVGYEIEEPENLIFTYEV